MGGNFVRLNFPYFHSTRTNFCTYENLGFMFKVCCSMHFARSYDEKATLSQ